MFCERRKVEGLYTNYRNTVFTWINERIKAYNVNNNNDER